MEYDFWNLLVNIFIAIGTCGATYFALCPRKEKEILEGFYWIYDNFIIVNITNKGKINCVFDTDSSLLLMKNETDIVESYEFKNKRIIPPNCTTNFNFTFSQTEYIKTINDFNKLSCCINTKNGTVVKLIKGMSDGVEINT